MEWHIVDTDNLDYTHLVHGTLTITDDIDWSRLGLVEGDVIVNTRLPSLLTKYSQWRASDLREIAHAHELSMSTRDTAQSLLERLSTHSCRRTCPTVLVVFRALQRRRTEAQVQRNRTRSQEAAVTPTEAYTQVASEELRRTITGEWQNAVSTEQFQHAVCGPCGRRTLSRHITCMSPGEFDLTLLRNDGLPHKVRPTTYAFSAYEGALLHPKGLIDRWNVNDIRMCEVCRRDLVIRRKMPRLCLANFLYYAIDELPPDVKRAFNASTSTERILLARARCSRISYRFTELRKRQDDVDGTEDAAPDNSGGIHSHSQRCSKGNVLVMPQDSTHLNNVLPPPPETIRDTVCAVFVGKSKPTRETIGKCGPLLVRKSRMLHMIRFITDDNPHYACDTEFHGFSQRNLDNLFGPRTEDQDEGIPCAVQVGFMQDSEAIRASVADYTERGVLESDADVDDNDTLLMDNVGYTMGDQAPVSYRDMKMKALSHCLGGGRFIRSQAGDRFIPDFENPSLLTWLFPHLDPWGIGGFHEPAREVPINMEEQLKYLLELDESPFERDPNFAFVYYNILQKKAVCDSVRFRVKIAEQTRVVRDLLAVDRAELERLIAKFKSNPRYEPETQEQSRLVSLVNKVGRMLHDLPGTAGYKLKLRNEIRALVNLRGTPAFFITLNPNDTTHPLVRLFSGDNIRLEHLEEGQELTEWKRMQLVARNPGACAKFFHTMISSFISIVLRYGKPGRGLLGKCTAYYGTVEAQGRGTLHCHMLVWLDGHPSPQKMRDMMVNSEQFQADMFTWLESIIKCELLGTTTVVTEPAGALPRPKLPKSDGYVHPGTTLGPRMGDFQPDQFSMRFASDVNDIVMHTNWHQHTETCWKNLRRGEARSDENCRMRIDGSTQAETTVDDETGAILLRRLHPRIASYNDLIIFLIRANMDIKHIGSGEGAKALIYYVTDYITKASLPAHIGLTALLYAINRTHDKYKDVPNWQETRTTGALTVLVNSMMARQEISHQQVMSYLVGGGDHYKSDKFRVLHYGTFERLVLRYWLREEDGVVEGGNAPAARDNNANGESASGRDTTASDDVPNVTSACFESLRRGDDTVTLFLGAGSISAVSQQQDYLYRPDDEPFASMGLYEFFGMTEKITKDAESRRILRKHQTGTRGRSRGRPEEARAAFTPEHPQYGTHVIRKRTMWVIPVLLGEKLPRPDRSDEEREQWARAVLTLFIPWRHPFDLKEESETWNEAYERHASAIAPEHLTIIHNMSVLSECRDARDKANLARKHAKLPVPTLPERAPSPDPFDVYDTGAQQRRVNDVTKEQDIDITSCQSTLLLELDKSLGARFRTAVDKCFAQLNHATGDAHTWGTTKVLTDEMRADIAADRATMRQLKRKRGTTDNPGDAHHIDRNVRPRLDRPPTLDTMTLGSGSRTSIHSNASSSYDPQDVVFQVVLEKNLLSNPEQLRAFEIVSKHATQGGSQLLMYIGGIGGTGKSHVVHSIIRLFTLLGRRNSILIGAPTGAAALLIGGHTIHSLTMLPDGPGRNFQELCRIWEGVDYLILDEVSMIGARFLSQLNARLMRAKGYEGTRGSLPFGGLNIIFTGDFGQLRPVRDPPLYSHKLVEDPGIEDCHNLSGISALIGANLWRRVSTVVLLKINQRQAGDKVYADLLSRVRVGEVKRPDGNSLTSDFALLKTRYADRLAEGGVLNSQDTPIVVGRRRIRDLLNLRIMGHYAHRLNETIHLYHAKDKIDGQVVSGDRCADLWKLSSSETHDSLGKLPLFPGMKVMVQENLAFTSRVVNGTEGTVRDIVYEEEGGKRYPVAIYVHIPGAGRICANAVDDVVPIFPEWTSFVWKRKVGQEKNVSVSRLQLPLLPSYAYTDYKSQGRSLDTAIVDPASASSLQGVYVMLSRLRALEGLVILRPFNSAKLEQRLSQELRKELKRLDELDDMTRANFVSTFGRDRFPNPSPLSES